MKRLLPFLLLAALSVAHSVSATVYRLERYGLRPGSRENAAPLLGAAVREITAAHTGDSPIVLQLRKGTYHFYPTEGLERELYISNHDQANPRQLGILLEGLKDLVLDGQGSRLVFHGRMLPLAVLSCSGCSFRNFSIDFENPHITQLTVLENDTAAARITFRIAPWVRYRIREGRFYATGEGWEHTPLSCIAFEGKSRHVVYNTGDLGVNFSRVREVEDHVITAGSWKEPRLAAGTVIAARTWYRPAPGILVSHCRNTAFRNVRVHYAEGMGLLAQMSENITLDGFSVCLKGRKDGRYFTTQADATHFSGCRGKVVSVNGLYEGMMDDAINVHGTYLKVMDCPDAHTAIAAYMHPQCWGFDWGFAGDTVQFVRSSTMEVLEGMGRIASICAEGGGRIHGARIFRIRFEDPLPQEIREGGEFGLENLSWTPEVLFADNVIRNNRARGSLFSTPKRTEVLDNLFDHTSGTAILLCGDCNGWYETGACRDVLIRGNRFVNALTNLFQFTNAVISIYPEIPDLKGQRQFFHGQAGRTGIVIEGNTFETFDHPLLYARSVQGLAFRGNRIIHNSDYPAFHWNNRAFFFEKVAGITIGNNRFDTPFDPAADILFRQTSPREIHAFR